MRILSRADGPRSARTGPVNAQQRDLRQDLPEILEGLVFYGDEVDFGDGVMAVSVFEDVLVGVAVRVGVAAGGAVVAVGGTELAVDDGATAGVRDGAVVAGTAVAVRVGAAVAGTAVAVGGIAVGGVRVKVGGGVGVAAGALAIVTWIRPANVFPARSNIASRSVTGPSGKRPVSQAYSAPSCTAFVP